MNQPLFENDKTDLIGVLDWLDALTEEAGDGRARTVLIQLKDGRVMGIYRADNQPSDCKLHTVEGKHGLSKLIKEGQH
jgi:hypothetical protein